MLCSFPKQSDCDMLLTRGVLELVFVREYANQPDPHADHHYLCPSNFCIKHMEYQRLLPFPIRSDGEMPLAHGALELIFAGEYAEL